VCAWQKYRIRKGVTMPDIATLKTAVRKQAFAARKFAHAGKLDATARAHLAAYLADLPEFTIIAGFMPIRTEIDPVPLMAELHKAGKSVSVPVIEGKGKPLRFSRWSPETAMIDGPFGAKIPAVDDFLEPDVLITPLLAYDARGYRLGYGGGFYDRSFQRLRDLKPITAVGFAYSAQMVPEVPTEATDQRLDAIVTETGTRLF